MVLLVDNLQLLPQVIHIPLHTRFIHCLPDEGVSQSPVHEALSFLRGVLPVQAIISQLPGVSLDGIYLPSEGTNLLADLQVIGVDALLDFGGRDSGEVIVTEVGWSILVLPGSGEVGSSGV